MFGRPQPPKLPLVFSAAALLLGLATIPVLAQRLTFAFDDDTLGGPPDGFFFAGARQTSPGTWDVRGSTARRHLVHGADPTVTLRGMSVAGVVFDVPQDVKVTVRLRLTDGDRAGGTVWRYKDAGNFYFMSVFHEDHSAALIRVTGGNRVQLDRVNDINLDPDAWHTVSVVHVGEEIRGSIDGIGILRARDRTLSDGNRAGVWSAGNTTGWFDDLVIEHSTE